MKRAFPLAALALLSAAALAQTLSTATVIGVSNTDYAVPGTLSIAALYSSDSDTAFTSGNVDASFSGLNRAGKEATMRFVASGFGRSDYGRLKTYTTFAVTDAFYNAENAPYINTNTGEINTEGTPDYFDAFAAARFTDPLQFGGSLQSGYRARYIFKLSGVVSGNAIHSANYQIQFGDNPIEYKNYFYFGGETVDETYATELYPINGATPETISVSFGTSTSGRVQELQDGDSLFGTGDFSSTMILSTIEIVDATGNPVSGVTVTSGSGTRYPVGTPVPEPATMSALALGGLALLARRRKRV